MADCVNKGYIFGNLETNFRVYNILMAAQLLEIIKYYILMSNNIIIVQTRQNVCNFIFLSNV